MAEVGLERREDIAVLSIDNPPVNAGSADQRAALIAALDDAAALNGVTAIVITTAGRHFYAGSDLREFDAPLAWPTLPDVIARVESLPIPVVAAIRGLALGGGLELALACDVRVATSDAEVGFPEVGFGIVPGAGGTVRSARLVGVPHAVDLVTSGRRVSASECAEIGLVDEVVGEAELVPRAVAAAADLTARRRLVDVAPTSVRDDKAELLARLPRRHRPNVLLAAELVIDGVSMASDLALARERRVFDELRVTPESQDLRYLFFAKQDAAKALRSGARPARIAKVGVVGAGTMGSGLARLFASHGYHVTVSDSQPEALARLDDAGMTTSTSLHGLKDADLVIEAVFEEMGVKQDLLRDLESIVGPDTLLVTNTSYLDLDEMGSVLKEPHRFGGLHFFNPPARNPLVEVIPAGATSQETSATLGAVATRLAKVPVLSRVSDGFIGNRVYADYRSQAEMLVEDGATPRQVDDQMRALGLAIGPFAVGDMSGLDIAWARRKRLASSRDPRQRYVSIADRLCEAGRLGRKTGAGWYAYPDGATRGTDDPAVEQIITQARADAGVVARVVDAHEIRQRVLGAMIAGAAVVRSTGTARQACDIDVAMTEGFAFPRHTGGPVRLFSRWSLDDQVRALAATYDSDPVTYKILREASKGQLPSAVQAMLDEVAPTQDS